MDKVVITGGAGFIGSTIARRLLGSYEVVLFDNLHRDAVTQTSLMEHPSLSLVQGDVRDGAAVEAVMAGARYVLHLASIAGVDTVMRRGVETMKTNLLGAINVLDAAEAAGAERVVLFSTSEVFGSHAFKVAEGDHTSLGAVGEARWTYAVSKLAVEHLALTMDKEGSIETAAVRPFNIYGPGQVGEGAIHHFIVRALEGEPLIIHNDGSQIRAWCYIDDIVRATVEVMVRPEAAGQVFNIGNPRSTVTVHGLAKQIKALVGSSSPITFVDWPYPDVELRIPSIDKARAVLGFEPEVDLDEGLMRTIEWYRATLEEAR